MAAMSGALDAGIVTIVISSVVARVLLALWTWPALRARASPWLRRRAWWPVPAERCAEGLLRELLTDAEYRHLCSRGYLDVVSPARPGRVYRVPRGPGLVLVLDGGRVTERLCVQPAESSLPEADVVLLHKLLIQSDEEGYLHTANHFHRAV
jgi:hypothetical protein